MGEFIHANFLIKVNPSNYLKIKNKIPPNVNILAVSKGFKSQEIKTIQNLGQNDFGESKFQEAFEKQLILQDLKQINWHFIGRLQTNKIRKFCNQLQLFFSSPVEFWDERYSSDIIFKEMRRSDFSSTKIKKN